MGNVRSRQRGRETELCCDLGAVIGPGKGCKVPTEEVSEYLEIHKTRVGGVTTAPSTHQTVPVAENFSSYMTQPQPIVHSAFQDDLSMVYSSSLNNPSGSFNPASYTRAFFGSPFSWRPGSFGNRSIPGTSPTQFLGPLEYVPLFSSFSYSSSRNASLSAPPTSAVQERYLPL